ncbi:MAG: hypothetical protein J5546_10640 [Lachnospiraceae bacterium]|nr:hypothetical protein [Lachnospiraceae bacterium]
MSKALEDMRREVAEETKMDMAKNLICMGKLTMEEISKVLGMPIEKVEEIVDDLLAAAK